MTDKSALDRTRTGVDASLPDAAAAAVNAARPRLREIFDTHAAPIARFVRYLGVHPADVDDVLQEIFVIVHRRLGELRDESKVAAWLRVIALNTVRNHRRARGRRRETPSAEPIEAEASGRPDEDLERARTRTQLMRLMDALPDEQRAVLVLYEIEQLAMRDIAETLGCPLQTAYTRLHAARQALRRAWLAAPGGSSDG
jgi:RNA polymerase sigma-70 factor (ECF subfamily)